MGHGQESRHAVGHQTASGGEKNEEAGGDQVGKAHRAALDAFLTKFASPIGSQVEQFVDPKTAVR